jgi:hypothetical protein
MKKKNSHKIYYTDLLLYQLMQISSCSIDPITDLNLNSERMYLAKKIQFEKKSQIEKRRGEKNFFRLEITITIFIF